MKPVVQGPSDIEERLRRLEKLGSILPSSPNGILLTSPHIESFLTQVIMNLEETTRVVRGLLDRIQSQKQSDFINTLGRKK